MRIVSDCAGVESMPMKLMIVALVACLSVVPASEALDSLRNRDLVRRAAMEMQELVTAAQVMAIQGPGNVRTLSFDLRSEGSLRFDILTIGDSHDGANVSSAMLRFTNGAMLIRTAVDPYVWLRSASGDALVIDSPVFELRLESVLENRTLSIVAEVR